MDRWARGTLPQASDYHLDSQVSMKAGYLRTASQRAMSLVEMMLSLTVGGFLLGGLILGFSTFQQVFAGVDDYYRATSDQMRVLDFIGQEMHRATSGTASNSTARLTLTLPDYIDESQNPPV